MLVSELLLLTDGSSPVYLPSVSVKRFFFFLNIYFQIVRVE